jgi:hypothetical protein
MKTDLKEIPELPKEIKDAAYEGKLVLFVGAGVSRLAGLPAWKTWAYSQLELLREKGFINFSELDQLSSLEHKKQLSIATFIAKENNFDLRLEEAFLKGNTDTPIYQHLNAIGSVCVTTNYDELLKPVFQDADYSLPKTTKPNRICKKEDILGMHLGKPGTVIHLHGVASEPETMIVTTKNYLEHYDDENVQVFLEELFQKYTVLFIGYGLEESEILEHILRRGNARPKSERYRFSLNGFFLRESPLYGRLYEYYSKSFGVHIIGYTRDYNDYNQLTEVIKSWAQDIKIRKPLLAEDLTLLNEVLGNE